MLGSGLAAARPSAAERFFELAADPLVVLDAEGRIVRSNPALSRLTGVGAEEMHGRRPLQHLRGGVSAADLLRRLSPGGPPLTAMAEIATAGGSAAMVEWHLTLDPQTGAVHGSGRDVTAHLRRTERMRRAAQTDPLTGLPNRTVIMRTLEQRLADGLPVTLLYVDLDGFKPVNDRHGHLHGDHVLTVVGQRIAGTVRKHDMVGRIGGDEFVVLTGDLEGAEALAERILDVIAVPISIDAVVSEVTASIGITTQPRGTGTAELVLNSADRALYQAKGCGGAAFSIG